MSIFKVFIPQNPKFFKNFKIELVPQFYLDPKDTWGIVRYRFWPKNVGIRILIFVPVFLKKWILKFLIFKVRVMGSYFLVAHERTLIFHLEFISGVKTKKYSTLEILIKKFEFLKNFKVLSTLYNKRILVGWTGGFAERFNQLPVRPSFTKL